MFEKTDVNGANEQPLFTYLKVECFEKESSIFESILCFSKSLCPSIIDEFHSWPNITYSPIRSNDLRWNFEKVDYSYFLVIF